VAGDDRQTEEIEASATQARATGRTRPVDTPFLTAGARLRGGRYVLERLLGRGGMAAVWLARDERLERPVAIKVLSDTLVADPGYLARFEREARVAAGLSHHALVRVFDYGAERGRPFLVMEYVAGGDLGERLAAGRLADPDRLARELLGALRHIHSAGVLHRDVKPQNVLLARDGGARLTDFGIAQPRDETSLTQTGMVIGTARYLAPEVLAGEPPTERSDLYSLGIVLTEANEARPGSPALVELIGSLRSNDAGARPESAAAALRMLGTPEVSAGEPEAPSVSAPTPQASTRRPRPDDRPVSLSRPAAIAALAATALAVVAVAVFAGGGDEPEPSQPAGERSAQNRPQAEDGAGSESNGEGRESQPQPAGGGNGHELNDRGYALINQGEYEEAIPVLERAVGALEGSEDITYAYALYNLGNALRLAGRPEDAIPILEARLEIPNQTEVVRSELRRARQDARGGNGDD
jgi:serine/threonine protein kinase